MGRYKVIKLFAGLIIVVSFLVSCTQGNDSKESTQDIDNSEAVEEEKAETERAEQETAKEEEVKEEGEDEVEVNIAKIEDVLKNEPFYPEMGERASEFGKSIHDWNLEGTYMMLEYGEPTGMGSSPIDGLLNEIKYKGYEITESNGKYLVTFKYSVDPIAIENVVIKWVSPEDFNRGIRGFSQVGYFDYYEDIRNDIDFFMEIAKGERAEFTKHIPSFLEKKTGLDVSIQAKTEGIDDINIKIDKEENVIGSIETLYYTIKNSKYMKFEDTMFEISFDDVDGLSMHAVEDEGYFHGFYFIDGELAVTGITDSWNQRYTSIVKSERITVETTNSARVFYNVTVNGFGYDIGPDGERQSVTSPKNIYFQILE